MTRILLFILLSVLAGCATQPVLAPSTDTQSLESLRDEFVAVANSSGRTLGFQPQIREWTRPSLISWREKQRTVAVPKWDDLKDSQKTELASLFGSEKNANEIFPWLFRWFLIPHELTHAIQNIRVQHKNHAQLERIANDVAAAFLNQTDVGKRRLAKLEQLMDPIVTALPSLDLKGLDAETYFDREYQRISQSPEVYGNFQLRFILDSLKRRDSLNLKQLMLDL